MAQEAPKPQTLGRYRIKEGQHENFRGERFGKGSVCEDKVDLARWDKNKFERVANDEPLSKPLPKVDEVEA